MRGRFERVSEQAWRDAERTSDRAQLMTIDEAFTAIAGGAPIVVEIRKYGIVANWYTAKNKDEFAEWLRRQAAKYLRITYNRTWRAWHQEPDKRQRETTQWA